MGSKRVVTDRLLIEIGGNWTTKILGGLFRGVNIIFSWDCTTIFLVDCFVIGGDRQTVFEFGGNWHYKIFGRIVSRSKLILFTGYFWLDCLVWMVTDRLFESCGNCTSKF